MAERKEILSDLSSKIAEGNIREAYRTFEDLPVVDQIAISLSPGVGDALAAYEVAEFGARAKTNIEDKDYLGAAGNYAMSGLSLASLIPLLRFLRGARGVAKSASKTVDAPTTPDKPLTEEPLQLSPPKKVEPELPEVQEFQPKPLESLSYKTGSGQPDLQSKARKFLNNYKVGTSPFSKTADNLTPEQWVEEFKKTQLPDIDGELRLLNVLDPAGDIHPKLIQSAGPDKKISREALDNYLARQQKDALQIRQAETNIGTRGTNIKALGDTQKQNLYFVRGSGNVDKSKYRNLRTTNIHYNEFTFPGGLKGEQHYAFDGVGRGFVPYKGPESQINSDFSRELADLLDLKGGEEFAGILRIQSDFAQKAVNKFSTLKREALDQFKESMKRNSLDLPYVVDILKAEGSSQSKALKKIMDPAFMKAVRANDEEALKSILGDDVYKLYRQNEFFVKNNKESIDKFTDMMMEAEGLIDGVRPEVRKQLDTVIPKRIKEALDDATMPTTGGFKRVIIKDGKFYKLNSRAAVKIQELDPDITPGEFKKLKLNLADYYDEVPREEALKDIYLRLDQPSSDLNIKDAIAKFDKRNYTFADDFSNPGPAKKLFDDMVQKYMDEYVPTDVAVDKFFAKITPEKVTGYVDPKKQKIIQKKLLEYNKLVDEINMKPRGAGVKDEVEEASARMLELGINDFELDLRDLERVTGQPFYNQLDKSTEEILYMIDPATGGQKYFDVPNNPGDLAAAYLKDTTKSTDPTFITKDGLSVLKKAVRADVFDDGFMPDPYLLPAKRGKIPEHSNFGKLPVRANLKKAYDEGADGLYLGKEQAVYEGMDSVETSDRIIAERYNRNMKEIEKVINELLPDPKKRKNVLAKMEGKDTTMDGVYVKFTDELKKAIEEKGIDAFKDGGPVGDDDLPEVGSIEPFDPYDPSFAGGEYVDPRFGDPVVRKLKKAFGVIGDIKEFILPTPKFTDPLSFADYVVGQTPQGKAAKAAKKAKEFLEDIELDLDDLDAINDWVESTKDIATKENFADVVKKVPLIKAHSIKHLKDQNLIDEDNTITVYRYLNIDESSKLRPDKGLTSTTLSPDHAKDKALERAEMTVGQLKPGEKADIFDSMDPIALQSKYEPKKLIRQPVVLEYKVPVEKVEAYVPAIYDNLSSFSAKDWRIRQADSYSHLVDDLVDDGYEYYDAVDSIADSYTVTSDFDNFAYTAFDESEIIADLTNIKPTNMFVDKKAIDSMAKITSKITKKAIGGPVRNNNDQNLGQLKRDEIEQELKDILGFNIYDNLFRDGDLDKLYKKYDASKDVREKIIDETESKLRESLEIPYKDEIIDILQSDDPKANLEERLDVFGTKQIDRALQELNLPLDIKKTQEGINLSKDIYSGDKFDVDFAGYKPDDGDFRGDVDFRYSDSGRFGNIDIQSSLDELGDINTYGRYGYTKGPIGVRAVKYPGRDIAGDVSYTLEDINIGKNQTLRLKAIVDQLKRAKFNLDYRLNNPKTGGFIDAGLGLSNRGGPELNISFGRDL